MSESSQAPPKGQEASAIRGSAGAKTATGTPPVTDQLVLTRDVATGDITNLEYVSPSGQRTEMSDDLVRKIAGGDEIAELESALDEAFDAGVDMLLGETTEDDGDYSDIDRQALVRLLLVPLVGGPTVRRIRRVRRKLFHQLVLRRLVRRYAIQRRIALT